MFVLLGALAPAGAPLALAAVRSLLGGAVLALAAVMRGGPRRLLLPGTGWSTIGCLALLNGAIAIGAMFLAAGQTDAAAATVVGNAQPILLAAAGVVLFAERPGHRAIAGIAAGAFGVLIVAVGSSSGRASLDGVALAFLSTAAPAAGTILMRWIARRADLLVTTAWQFLGGGLALLAAAALIEPPPAARLDGAVVGALLLLGIVGTGLAYVAWFGLLQRVPLSHLGAALYLVPVIGVVADALAGGRVAAPDLVGLGVMLAGVVLVANQGRRPGPVGVRGSARGA